MATDATGSPTPLGIPKLNTSADAPSGLGFNAAMDSVDALITQRMSAPASPATGDVPVWNGSTWVVPSGSRTGSKFLRDDGSWNTPTVPVYVKSLMRGAATSNVVNTVTTAQDLITGSGLTLNAGDLSVGSALTAKALLDFSNSSGGALTVTWSILWNATAFTGSATTSVPNGSTNIHTSIFELSLIPYTNTNVAMYGQLRGDLNTAGVYFGSAAVTNGVAANNITSATNNLQLRAAWSATGTNASIETRVDISVT